MTKPMKTKKALKKILLALIQIMFVLIILECSPYLFFPVFLHQSYSRGIMQSELLAMASESRDETLPANPVIDDEMITNVLHPYLGFVALPRNDYNRFGFLGDDPLQADSKDCLNICLTGGSVAKGLYVSAKEYLIQELKRYPPWSSKKIRICLLALGGYKQPQQMLAVNYFLSIGASFDIVINLDGFNEVVLPYTDNLPFGVFPSYPRNWNLYTRKSLDPGTLRLIARKSVLQEDQRALKRFFSRFPFRYSNFSLMIWKILDQRKKARLYEMELSLREALENTESGYQATGPKMAKFDTVQYFITLAGIWKASSLQMARLASSMEFLYVHFLQPNQYVEDSKIFTDEERFTAIEQGDFSYKKAVRLGYPVLIREGKKLRESGVIFHDLTPIFRQEKRTIYADACCHFNELGYRMIADRIVNIIHQEVKKKPLHEDKHD